MESLKQIHIVATIAETVKGLALVAIAEGYATDDPIKQIQHALDFLSSKKEEAQNKYSGDDALLAYSMHLKEKPP